MDRSQADSINDSGQIVGISDNVAGIYRGFLYSNGTMQDLGCLPNFGSSEAIDINASGQVVGMLGDWTTNPYTLHAFIDENGQMEDLNTLTTNLGGWVLQTAEAINDSGQIVGYGTLNGNTRGSS